MKKDLGLIKDEDDKETDKVERKKGGKHKKRVADDNEKLEEMRGNV